MRDGELHLIMRLNKAKNKQEINIPKKLNDGQWHHVLLSSVNNQLITRIVFGGRNIGSRDVAGEIIESTLIRLPKRFRASNVLYIGGISESSSKLPPELLSKVEEFKGCIRKFRVNNSTQDLAPPDKHNNVGQCFPNVEKGSYFPGDAFAIYSKYKIILS